MVAAFRRSASGIDLLLRLAQDYVLSGTPTTAGDYGFEIQVTNGTETAIYYYTMEIR